ncbi:hypothetical protein CHU98_g10318 [Xylaria longipes]|nr:hypothetical protein CHU98_g10318 [Xylaria longipes]
MSAIIRQASCGPILDVDDENSLLKLGLVFIDDNTIHLDRRIKYFIEDLGKLKFSNGAQYYFPSQIQPKQDEFPRFLGEDAKILVYLGFSQSKAEEVAALATRELRERPQMNRSWLSIVLDNAVHDSVADIGQETEYWWPLFQQLGLSEELHKKIMHLEHSQIRDTETAKFWIRDTMEIRYGQLRMIQECSKERGAQIRARRSRFPPWSFWCYLEPPYDLRSVTADPDESVPDGYISLWKALALSRVEYDNDGRISYHSLRTNMPSDFAGTFIEGPALYFTQDRAISVMYADYAMTRLNQSQHQADDQDAVLLRLLVKKSWVESIWQFVKYDDWKKIVFLSRNGKALVEQEGQALGVAWYAGEKLLIGRIAHSVKPGHQTIETWFRNTNTQQMNAEQWVFRGLSAFVELLENSTIALDRGCGKPIDTNYINSRLLTRLLTSVCEPISQALDPAGSDERWRLGGERLMQMRDYLGLGAGV